MSGSIILVLDACVAGKGGKGRNAVECRIGSTPEQ